MTDWFCWGKVNGFFLKSGNGPPLPLGGRLAMACPQHPYQSPPFLIFFILHPMKAFFFQGNKLQNIIPLSINTCFRPMNENPIAVPHCEPAILLSVILKFCNGPLWFIYPCWSPPAVVCCCWSPPPVVFGCWSPPPLLALFFCTPPWGLKKPYASPKQILVQGRPVHDCQRSRMQFLR